MERAHPGLFVGEDLRNMSTHDGEVGHGGAQIAAVAETPVDSAGRLRREGDGPGDPEHLGIGVNRHDVDSMRREEPREGAGAAA